MGDIVNVEAVVLLLIKGTLGKGKKVYYVTSDAVQQISGL